MKNKKLFAILTLVCFMFTLMPVAAFAGDAVADTSVFTLHDDKDTVKTNEAVNFLWQINDNGGKTASNNLTNVYIWAVDAAGNRTSALEVFAADGVTPLGLFNAVDNTYGPYPVADGEETKVSFARPGVYTVYAGTYNAGAANQTIANAVKLIGGSEVTVIGGSTDPQEYYRAKAEVPATSELVYTETAGKDLWTGVTGVATDGETMGTVAVKPNK